MTADPLRVVVVDDQALVRSGFTLILERAGVEVVGEAADGLEALQVVGETDPDVVLMDVRMPRLDGIEATRRLTTLRPDLRVVLLTTFDLDEYVYAGVAAGASGFLLKDVTPADLVHAVRAAARGDTMLAPTLTRRLLERFASGPVPGVIPPELTALPGRELEVLRLVADGLSNAEIGASLHLSEATVKTYVSRLLTRLDLRDRVQLAVLAYRTGLTSP